MGVMRDLTPEEMAEVYGTERPKLSDAEHATALREAANRLNAAMLGAWHAGLRVDLQATSLVTAVPRRDPVPHVDVRVWRPL